MPTVARPPRRHSLVWLQGLGCGAVVTLLPAMALLLGVLLLPGVLAVLSDQQPGRPVARTVLICGTAAAIAPVLALWGAGSSMDACLGLLGDLRVTGTAWSAAAVGWILAELAPVVVLVVLDAITATRTARLRAERNKLVEEWGYEGEPDTNADAHE
ncbi:MAG TPA: hypothetical protein VMU81_24030 [Acetobacteraceae bacterium]|jgi:hypothetical protein|nr:hypothetical protein [Acetobacteraceae bacterium]